MTDADRMEGCACAACGMHTKTRAEYHPWAVCELFKAKRDSRQVRANIRAVVEYGMKAERAGITLDQALASITWMHADPPKAAPPSRKRKVASRG